MRIVIVAVLLTVNCMAGNASSVAAATQSPTPPTHPNIVFLLGDDLRPDCLGALGHPLVKTPNLDAIAKRGLAFRNAYVAGGTSGAVCMPSRTMLLTGIHSRRIPNGELWKLKRPIDDGKSPVHPDWLKTPTLPQTFKAAGYATCRSGKSSNNPNALDADFDEHFALQNHSGKTITESSGGDTAKVHADHLISFIQAHAGKQPMFLYMAPHEPHDPQYAPADWYAKYKPEEVALPAAFLPLHPFNNGEMTVRDEKTLPWPRTPEAIRGKLARYYASIAWWDSQVARVVQALKDSGQYDNTIFVIAGDNGLSLGEHGLLGKQNLYEFGGMHVPLIFAGPGVSAKGDTQAFAYLYDVYPTLCDLVGIPVPASLDARSLAPILAGKDVIVHDVVSTSYTNCQRAIRDGNWKLIRYPQIGKTQLFDLAHDAHEEHDVSQDPAHRERIHDLLAKLKAEMTKVGDMQPLEVAQPKPWQWTPPEENPKEKDSDKKTH